MQPLQDPREPAARRHPPATGHADLEAGSLAEVQILSKGSLGVQVSLAVRVLCGKWARFGTWTKLEADAAPVVRSNPTYWSWLTILFWIGLAKLRGERY